MKPIILLAVLLSACTLPFDPPPHPARPDQEQAVAIVWAATYEADRSPPVIEWLKQSAMNCLPDADGNFVGFFEPTYYGSDQHTDRCLAGITWEGINFIQLARSGYTFDQTSLAHELFHAYLYDMTGDGDNQHLNPGFGPAYGHAYGIVDRANDALRDALL
jgi:hypothetical protein